MEQNTELAIDIGGGAGERFLDLARHNPQKTYLVLDPNINNISDKPDNLHLMPWRGDKSSAIPLPEESVNVAGISFLFGEMISREIKGYKMKDEKERYRVLITDLKRVLKRNGMIEIVDVKGNIKYVVEVLEEVGFKITQKPQRLKKEDYSPWSKIFFSVFYRSGKSEEESEALPMMVKSVKG